MPLSASSITSRSAKPPASLPPSGPSLPKFCPHARRRNSRVRLNSLSKGQGNQRGEYSPYLQTNGNTLSKTQSRQPITHLPTQKKRKHSKRTRNHYLKPSISMAIQRLGRSLVRIKSGKSVDRVKTDIARSLAKLNKKKKKAL